MKNILNISQSKIKERIEKIEWEKSKNEAILSSLGDGVLVIDKDRNIVLFNHAAERILGYESKKVLKQNYRKFIKFCFINGDCLPFKFSPVEKALKNGGVFTTDPNNLIYYQRQDKTSLPVYIKVSPIKLKGEIIGAAIVFRDMTIEQQIDRMKTEFVFIASHQLRTPLTFINWNIELLLSGDVCEVSKKQKVILEDIYDGTQRMKRLVNDLLNVSRLELGRLKIEPELIQLETFVQDIIKEVSLIAKAKNCKLIFKKPTKKLPKIFIDQSLIWQVVDNLIINAIRYSSQKRKSNIIISLKKQKNDYLITVHDNGIGIPLKSQKRVFERFFRADNAVVANAEGNGLGLYISKMIVNSSGGEIWFNSNKSNGTTFYLRLPIKGMKKKKGKKGLVASYKLI